MRFYCKYCEDQDSKTYLYQISLKKHLKLMHPKEYEEEYMKFEFDPSLMLWRQEGEYFVVERFRKDIDAATWK